MSTATVEILEEAYEDNPKSAALLKQHLGLGNAFSKIKASAWLEKTKAADLAHQLGKGVRPWEIVNVSGKLDPKQPWFGVEYETGYNTKDQYTKVINHVWANHPLTAIDREGCGEWPVEITFAPVNMDVFMSKEYHMDKLLKFQKEASCPHARHSSNDNIGTHVNVSTPTYRNLTRGDANHVAMLMNATNRMQTDDCQRVFGRRPYGGYSPMSDLRANQWIEGKLFNSTGSPIVWAKYKKVMSHIGELIEHFSRLARDKNLPTIYRRTKDGLAIDRDTVGGWENWPNERDLDVISCPDLAKFLLGAIELDDLKFPYKAYRRKGVAVHGY